MVGVSKEIKAFEGPYCGPIPIKNDESLDELLLEILDKLQKKEFDLPPLPQVASRVLSLTIDADANAAQLTALIEQDPVLTAKIFQTSNSAACGASRKIESLSQAVAWLGLNTVAGTAYALSVQSGVFDVQGYAQDVQGLWTHALASGFYGKAIAAQVGQNEDTAFLCGLLHEIGKPFVVHTVNQYQQASAQRIPWTAMQRLFKESSSEVGRQLALAWEFPDPVKEAINLYDDHAFHLGTSPTSAAPITNLANYLATHFVDQEIITEDQLRNLPVIDALHIPEPILDDLLNLQDTIGAQVKTMLV